MPENFDDPVLAEVHAVRAAMLEAAGGDINVLMERVAERQQRSKRKIIIDSFRSHIRRNSQQGRERV